MKKAMTCMTMPEALCHFSGLGTIFAPSGSSWFWPVFLEMISRKSFRRAQGCRGCGEGVEVFVMCRI